MPKGAPREATGMPVREFWAWILGGRNSVSKFVAYRNGGGKFRATRRIGSTWVAGPRIQRGRFFDSLGEARGNRRPGRLPGRRGG